MWVHIGAWAWGSCLFGPHFSACSAFGFPHKQEVSWNSTSLTRKQRCTEHCFPRSISLYLLQSQALLGVLGLHSSMELTASYPHGKPCIQGLHSDSSERMKRGVVTHSAERNHTWGLWHGYFTPRSTEHRVKSSGVEHTAGTDMGIWLDRNVSENLVEEASIHPECQPVFSVPQETTVFPLG